VGKTTLARVVPSAIPFFIAMAVALMFITYVPELSLWLPRQFGL
jgi:TRAP-type C4-dicarboxylate transport system permease large subunit